MTKIPNRDEQLARCRYQYDQIKLYAERWHTIAAIQGNGVRVHMEKKWRPSNEWPPNEKAGVWAEETIDEAVRNSLSIALTHIQRLEGLGEIICALESDDPIRLEQAMKSANEAIYC